MSPQALIALTTALIGLAACTPEEFNAALNRIEGKEDQQARDLSSMQQTLALYAQVSSQESTSSSSSIAASQVSVAEQPVVTPEPPRESCDHSVVRLYDCIDNLRYYW